MPSIDENLQAWNGEYEWSELGDEWSQAWGGASAQWYGTILPRLHSYLPAGRVLEIAPGFGRWTQYLRPLSDELILVDLSAKCIEACRQRFAGFGAIEYHVNDGESLAMVADGSIDLAFSFDSLVHVEAGVLRAYVAQLARKLRRDGIGFLHHSNLGEFVDPTTGELQPGLENRHWRAQSVSADWMKVTCETYGLTCVSQEIVNWGGPEMNDVFTVFTPTGSRWSGRGEQQRNPEFMREADNVARLARAYDWGRLARGA
jgi:SAM-dependent methyltransferase